MSHGFTPFSFPPLISSCFLPLPLPAYFCLRCSPLSHRIGPRSSKHTGIFELMSPEVETKMRSSRTHRPSPLKTFSSASLGSHARPLTHRFYTGPWGTKTGRLGDVPLLRQEVEDKLDWQSHQNHAAGDG